jgi:predicted nucleic acid-binding protein
MSLFFADSFYSLACLNQFDGAHKRAVRLAQSHVTRTVTTEFVLLEVADAFASPPARVTCARFLQQLRTDPMTRIVRSSARLFDEAFNLYATRLDKGWSLTDCASFVVMNRLRISDALTADHHFAQAGFRILL